VQIIGYTGVVEAGQSVYFSGAPPEIQTDYVPAAAVEADSHAKHVFFSRVAFKAMTDHSEFIAVFSRPVKMPVNIDKITILGVQPLPLRSGFGDFSENGGVERLYMSISKGERWPVIRGWQNWHELLFF
jgi:hypothetical protein